MSRFQTRPYHSHYLTYGPKTRRKFLFAQLELRRENLTLCAAAASLINQMALAQLFGVIAVAFA
jgi:hypothetical protein